MATPAVTENVKCHDICHLFTDSTKHQSRLYFWSNNVFFRVRGYSMCSDNSTQENGLGVSVPQRSPLHKEIVRYGVEDPPTERQCLHSANAFHINNHNFLYSQNSEQEPRCTQRNAGPGAITQH